VAETFVRQENRTDFLGAYTAYVYADGHVETDPPGRPVSKEDVQRQRRAAVAREDARRLLAADRAKQGRGGVPLQVQAEQGLAVTLRPMTQQYHETLNIAMQLAELYRTPSEVAKTLVETIDLGGPVVGPNAGKRPEFGEDPGLPGAAEDLTNQPTRTRS